ncbi:hypothetical protein WICMUC_003806 [Wickerhamomyces mucosus]|uniref:Calponin-homology (CH) domain-containing protein n=1 Tax=Wickerhamomyces mucosus TaxID=1378264 RepID=A0A9P8TB98_9ASCO|nr:hypothetical protein WICMUC_003806 [Wickerhamomyces mucosus]
MEDSYQRKADVSSLDSDLKELRKSKFDQNLANEAKNWILAIIGETTSKPFIELIKSGVVLCKLANSFNETHEIKFKESSLPFIQMENISKFLNFVKAYGVPQDEVFQTIDLYEEQDTTIVLQTIISFSRYVHIKNPDIPVIGPKLTKKQPPAKPKKPVNLVGWNGGDNCLDSGSTSPEEDGNDASDVGVGIDGIMDIEAGDDDGDEKHDDVDDND